MCADELAHLTVHVVVLGGAGSDEFLLPLVGRIIRLSSSAPGGDLGRLGCSLLHLDRVMEFVVAWAWTIHLFRLKMRLGPEGRVKTPAIGSDLGWRHALFVEARAELVVWTSERGANLVSSRSGELSLFVSGFVARRSSLFSLFLDFKG